MTKPGFANGIAVPRKFRQLDDDKIIGTLEQLERRITARFAGSGLREVCRELTVMAQEAANRSARIARPNLGLRVGIGLILCLALAALALLIARALSLNVSGELSTVMQGLDALVSLMLVLGGLAIFLWTLEARWRRDSSLAALHEFRSIVHVIDMHQLTKDPSAIGGPRTSASPERPMTPYELVRYLDYCSEMLSLASKTAALYAEKVRDPAVIDAVGDIERLTTNLSQKIWQKITIVQSGVHVAAYAPAKDS